MIPPETFHLFSCLPAELQHLIWDHAVRPVAGDRHVHNFLISDYMITYKNTRRKVPGDTLRFNWRRRAGARIYVPHESERYPKSRTTTALEGLKDESVYSTDSGLWTACQASRSAMERYFTKNEWWSNPDLDRRDDDDSDLGRFEGQAGRSLTIAYYSSAQPCHEPRWITTRPDQDLIILKHPGLKNVDWYHFFDWNFPPTFPPLFLGRHVAFDFDPVWLDVLYCLTRRAPVRETADKRSIIDMILTFLDVDIENVNPWDEDSYTTIVWLIDHRLRRVDDEDSSDEKSDDGVDVNGLPRPQASCRGGPFYDTSSREHKSKRTTFRSVNYIFTEVKEKDMETKWRIDDHIEEAGTVWEFLENIEKELDLVLGDNGAHRRVKVLAREPVLGSDGTVDIGENAYRKQLGDACF